MRVFLIVSYFWGPHGAPQPLNGVGVYYIFMSDDLKCLKVGVGVLCVVPVFASHTHARTPPPSPYDA